MLLKVEDAYTVQNLFTFRPQTRADTSAPRLVPPLHTGRGQASGSTTGNGAQVQALKSFFLLQ